MFEGLRVKRAQKSFLSNEMVLYSVALVLLTATFAVFGSVDVYMDEIFHVPQAQRYCAQDFVTWDPKITTLPGLYLWSYLVTGLGRLKECSPRTLRLTNVMLGAYLPIVCWRIRKKLFAKERPGQHALVSALIFLYPVVFFFFFLYYSDTPSLVFVLALYDAMLPGLPAGKMSMSVGTWLLLFSLASAAILARQTNVVWVAFVGASCTLSCYEKRMDITQGNGDMDVGRFIAFMARDVVKLSRALSPLVLPCLAFVGFVVHNGGLVLGDKENHVSTLHWAMFFHPFALTAMVYGPLSAWDAWSSSATTAPPKSKKPEPSAWSWRMVGSLSVTTVGAGYALMRGVLSHPFLLADNRHYTFYLWKHVLSSERLRMCLVPVYSACVVFVGWSLQRAGRTAMWTYLLYICAAASLAPLPLFEPRYFTIVVTLLLLHMPAPSMRGGMLAIATALLTNAVFIYVFVYRPFHWPDGSTARFMF